jgi:hypothetical protein
MKVRIYTSTNTRINEDWNSYGDCEINTNRSQSHRNPIIIGKPNGHTLNKGLDFYQSFYEKIAIDIVTETVFNYPYPQITEKTVRPLVNKRMFIIVGAPYTLRFLRSHGFKTFSPFISEDYDLIENPKVRIKTIFSEIDRITKIPLDVIQQNMLKYNDVLEHNFKTLKNIEKIELEKIHKRFSTCD